MSKIIDDIKSDPKGALLVFGILILIIAYVLFSGHREAVQKEEQANQGSASTDSASSSSTENKDDDVIDAEYTKE